MPRLILLMILLLAATGPASALAQGSATSPAATATRSATSVRGAFSSADRNLIRAWLLEAQRRAAPRQPTAEFTPGLETKMARGQPLAPGWQQKLTRGERLERAAYAHGVALPDELTRRLSPPPPGTEILQIEDRILRLDAATRTILDVFALGGQ
jgi:hypothetical protein